MHEPIKIEETIDVIKEYVNTRCELIVLKGSDQLSHIGSKILSIVPFIFLTILSLFMLSFALAFYLNTLLGNEYGGFLIVVGGYLIIGFFLMCVRKNLIEKPLRNKIIKELFKNNNL